MTRKLIYTPDAAGEYTIAEESENWVTDIGQVENESDARLFCAAPKLQDALELLILFTKPSKFNSVALHHAHSVLKEIRGETK